MFSTARVLFLLGAEPVPAVATNAFGPPYLLS
jgi:hypothetical protein